MASTKLSSLLLLLTILISTTITPILSCGHCPPSIFPPNPSHPHPRPRPPPKGGPVVLPPIIGKPPFNLPPTIGGGGSPPSTGNTPCPPGQLSPPPPPPPSAMCPVDTLKLGACVDLLGGLVHIGLGDPVVNRCCPLLQGLVEIEAAVCLCTTIRLKLLNINLYLPLALQLLLTCGKTPPPGYTCTV